MRAFNSTFVGALHVLLVGESGLLVAQEDWEKNNNLRV